MVQFNNTNNAVALVSEIKLLTVRLDRISKRLDVIGPVPAGLREATLKKLGDVEKNHPTPDHCSTLMLMLY
jgi:hypothetical protein